MSRPKVPEPPGSMISDLYSRFCRSTKSFGQPKTSETDLRHHRFGSGLLGLSFFVVVSTPILLTVIPSQRDIDFTVNLPPIVLRFSTRTK